MFEAIHEAELLASVLPLRLVSLKWRDPGAWAQVADMAVDTLSEALWSSVKTVYDKFLYIVSRFEKV